MTRTGGESASGADLASATELVQALEASGLDENLIAKGRRLVEWFVPVERCLVAFSAGIDSTLVAWVAARVLGDRAVAVTGDGPSLARHELAEARSLAQHHRIQHIVLATHEIDRDGYRANGGDRCFFCKDQLYTQLRELAEQTSPSSPHASPQALPVMLVNGANLNDLGDHRPGMRAAEDHGVRSPLLECQLTKADVRALAAWWGLENADKPAAPCLASRVAYGVEVTAERLEMIQRGESLLRSLGLREFRLRLHADDLARIEVPLDALPKLIEPDVRESLARQLREIGFRYVTLDLMGFRSGNLNEQLVQIGGVSAGKR